MLKNLKEMTWGMHAFHLFMFALGVMAVIIYAIHHDNPKLEGNPIGVIALGGGLMGGAIYSFVRCLFDKPEGQYQNPDTIQDQKREERTATH